MPAPACLLATLVIAAAPSFDCRRSQSADERAVCASEPLAALDRRLAAAYSWALALREANVVDGWVKADQVAWLGRRRACAAAAACLEARYRERLEVLGRLLPGGWPEAVLVRRRQAERGANGCEERSAAWPELAAAEAPSVATFNAFFQRGWSAPCVPSKEPPDPDLAHGALPPGVPGTSETTYEVRWVTARFVTIVFQESTYGAGAAHPNTAYRSTTFDLAQGRPLDLADVLAQEADRRQGLAEEVLRRLSAEYAPSDFELDDVSRAIADAGAWIMDGGGATIRFPRYSVAPYAAGDLEVRFAWKELGPWRRPAGALPAGR